MKSFLSRIAGLFTETRRAAIQAFIASIITVLVMLGATTEGQGSALTDVAASVLLALQGVIGLSLLRRADYYTWFNTTGRGIIYSLAGAVGVAGVWFAVWDEATSAAIVSVSTAVASILVAAVQMMNVGTVADAVTAIEIPEEHRHDVIARVADRYGYTIAPKLAEADTALLAADLARADLDVSPLVPEGLAVGVYAPSGHPLHTLEPVFDLGDVQHLDIFEQHEEFRGTKYDVILTTVPLTRDLLAEFQPATVTSTFDGRGVRSIADKL